MIISNRWKPLDTGATTAFITNWNQINFWRQKYPETYSETSQTSKMKLFAKIVNGFQPLTILAKSSSLEVWQGSEYASITYSIKSTKMTLEQCSWTFLRIFITKFKNIFAYMDFRNITVKKFWCNCFSLLTHIIPLVTFSFPENIRKLLVFWCFLGGHSINTYAKFSEKLTFHITWYAHVRVRIRG